MMVLSFVFGVAFALLQHFLYRRLHHLEVKSEDKKFRWVLYGRVLAYLAKISFGGCVILVFRQRIWRVFRNRALSVSTIDHFFGATEDLALFSDWEAVSKAPLVVAIAVVIWLIPIATIIFSPGALTFGTYVDHTTIDLKVPIIDFATETKKDWRNPWKVNGTIRKSVMYYNTTDREGKAPGFFDYYDQPSADLKQIAILLAYSNVDYPNLKQDARQQVCGGSYNCTYEQSFVGPGYQCEEVARGIDDLGRLGELGAPFNTSFLAPKGRHVYYADVDSGAYARPQNVTFKEDSGGAPEGEPPADFGVFKSEPVLWIGFSVNSTERLPKEDPLAVNWTHRYDPHILRCVHMETMYTVKWNFTEPYFNAKVNKTYLTPIVDTKFDIGDDGKIDYSKDPKPAENYVRPQDPERYKKVAAYYAFGATFRDFLRGYMEIKAPNPGPSYVVDHSDFKKTRLVQKNSEPKQDLGQQIESFYDDMLLSLLAAPQMLAVNSSETSVNRTRLASAFEYMPEKLWQCYAAVIIVTFLILIFGLITIWEDGATFSVGFSRLLVTTRNTTLDDISRGACLGNDPFPKELMYTRLKFGVLTGAGGEYTGDDGSHGFEHCAFGVPSEIKPIVKGVPYAGLRKRNYIQHQLKKADL